MKYNFIFLLFLLLSCLSSVSAMELAEIKLVDIDTMTVEAESRQNESYYTSPSGEVYQLEGKNRRSISSSANISNPLNDVTESLTSYMTVMVIFVVGFTVVGSVMRSLKGGDF